MMIRLTILLLSGLLLTSGLCAQNQAPQDSLPYREIPDYPDEYHAGTVAARMVDGLGFRYYWATEGLRQEDLDFRPEKMRLGLFFNEPYLKHLIFLWRSRFS